MATDFAAPACVTAGRRTRDEARAETRGKAVLAVPADAVPLQPATHRGRRRELWRVATIGVVRPARAHAVRAARLAAPHVRALPPIWSQSAGIALTLGLLFLGMGLFRGVTGAGDIGVSAYIIVGAMSVATACSVVVSGALLAGLTGVGWYASTSVFTTSITVGMFANIAWDGAGSMVGFVFVPASVGTWFAAVWTRKLYNAGVRGAALVEATTTVRGLAFAWALIMGVVALSWVASLFGVDVSLDNLLGDGLADLVGVAAAVAYAGSGYTEYRNAIDSRAQLRLTRARKMRTSRAGLSRSR